MLHKHQTVSSKPKRNYVWFLQSWTRWYVYSWQCFSHCTFYFLWSVDNLRLCICRESWMFQRWSCVFSEYVRVSECVRDQPLWSAPSPGWWWSHLVCEGCGSGSAQLHPPSAEHPPHKSEPSVDTPPRGGATETEAGPCQKKHINYSLLCNFFLMNKVHIINELKKLGSLVTCFGQKLRLFTLICNSCKLTTSPRANDIMLNYSFWGVLFTLYVLVVTYLSVPVPVLMTTQRAWQSSSFPPHMCISQYKQRHNNSGLTVCVL